MLSAFYLTSYEKRTELNSFESKSSTVLVTGIDSRAARSVVLVGKLPGYPVMRDSQTGRVYTSATGDHVIDSGQQQILGTVDGLAHACGPSSKESHQCLRHVCSWTSSRFRLRLQQQRFGPCGKQFDWRERTCFKLRNRVWELEIAVMPKAETEEILTKMQKQDVGELCPVEEQFFLTVRPDEMGVPRVLGPTVWTKSKRVGTSWKRATMTLHASQARFVPELYLSVQRDRTEKITKLQATCRTGVGARHVWLDVDEAMHT